MAEHQEDQKLLLFKVDDGSVTYWVVAHRAEDCVDLVAKVEQLDPAYEWDWDESPPAVTRVEHAEAVATRLTDEGRRNPSTMAEGYAATREPGVLACSEWP